MRCRGVQRIHSSNIDPSHISGITITKQMINYKRTKLEALFTVPDETLSIHELIIDPLAPTVLGKVLRRLANQK